MDSKVVLKEKNPHDKANILSKILLCWSLPLFKGGYKQGLTVDDLFQARSGDHSGRLGDRLEEAWLREKEKCKNTKDRPSLTKAILSCFWVEYMMCGLLVGLLYIVLWPMMPYSLSLFIEYFAEERTPETYRNAHIYNFILNFLTITTALMLHHVTLSQSCVGMRVRIAACSILYRKILRLNRIGLSKTEPGQVINLMSNDVNRFDQAALYLHYIWMMPFVVPVVSYLVWQHIGYATLAALAVVAVQSVLVQAYLSKRQGALRGKIARRTDQRVKVMSELVNGVQVIKMYAWEKPFEKLVDKLRKWEVKFILRTSGEIRSGITFSLVQYYNLMQLACNIYFPLALAMAAESRVSIRRLEDFLLLEELDKEEIKMVGIAPNISNGTEKDNANSKFKPSTLVLSNLSASWQPNPIVHTLRNISLTAHPGEFVGVAGLVGSGKSTLLQVILGELPPAQGSINIGGARIAYASQEPWLFVASVKQNILFGLPYDKLRYKKTSLDLISVFYQSGLSLGAKTFFFSYRTSYEQSTLKAGGTTKYILWLTIRRLPTLISYDEDEDVIS
ncbi:unnamed protein product [Euphydryas editha]|uniref:ABC transmembrane type-1 domain-containing protein n=1 Tax=Euphydryas editha TaxID=104508 RepID=A0AAU9UL35_EUPED|nr:unnamed protein product [Euphydryas editha]